MGPLDSLGDSAVNLAVEHVQILEYLLQLGADMNIRRKDGRSALLAAAWMGKPNPNPNLNLNLNLTLTLTLTLILTFR
jgi:ankyrin repeat protein